MTLAPGTRLGPYEILAPLGSGGMGEVYRAQDPRLGRDVAIKVLPPEVARDADRRARFEREARAVAALSHPHILAVFDVGTDADQLYVVTELLDGETLFDRLLRGALPVRKAVDIAVALARGLGAAHDKGIAHRDLKPANVFLLQDGHVKILDFGLARALAAAGSGTTETQAALTEPGTVLGTVGYMAPEQIRGAPVDGRADLFALGVVLYEMLAGTRAFARETPAETLTAILKEEPSDLMATRADLTPALDRIVRHCLEKQPAERFQTARDVAFALETLSGSGGVVSATAGVQATPPGPRRRGSLVAGMGFGVALAALIASAVVVTVPVSIGRRPLYAAIDPPYERFHLEASPALSPDGRLVAFWAPNATGVTTLWTRDLESRTSRELTGTALGHSDAEQPFFAPDSRALAYFGNGKLQRLDLATGAMTMLADAVSPAGGAWSSTGTIVYQPAAGGPLHAIDANGGRARALALPIPDADALRYPNFLPDGDRFLVTAKDALYVGSVRDQTATRIMELLGSARYRQGFLFTVANGALIARRFDPDTLAQKGAPITVLGRVGTGRNSYWNSAYDVSDRSAVAWEGAQFPSAQLTWVDRTGRRLGTVWDRGPIASLTASRELDRVAVERDPGSGVQETFVIDVASGISTRAPFSLPRAKGAERLSGTPVLSADGRRLWVVAWPGVYGMSLDGGAAERIVEGNAWMSDVSADGRWLMYTTDSVQSGTDLWVIPATGGPPQPFAEQANNPGAARFSPDGRWVAYHEEESGPTDVYVEAFPRGGRRQRLSPNGGHHAQWRADGREIYYIDRSNTLVAVEVTTSGDALRFSPPRPLFAANTGHSDSGRRLYAVTPDGQRFLVAMSVEDSTPRHMRVLLDWRAVVQ